MWYFTMKLLFGSIITVSIRYTYLRDASYYYQRKIPKDLLDRYDGQKSVKANLNTLDPTELTKKVTALNRLYESTWKSMRNNSSITPTSIRANAINLLAQYGLKPLPTLNPDLNIELFLDLVVAPKRDKAAQGDDELHKTISPHDYLTTTEAEAYKLLCTAPKLLLSEALSIYLNGHEKSNDEVFKRYATRTWNKLIEILGDIPFESVNKDATNEFITKLLATGNKTTTVKRIINSVKAVFNVILKEKELTKNNPFDSPRIPGLGKDALERNPFSASELITLSQACKSKDDDMRWLIALQMDLGCRLGEVAGLSLDDIKLDSTIPYVSIKPHEWRTLKTKGSKRDVPLVGMSLWAAHRIVSSATKGQVHAFPRYTDNKTCRATAASGALNSWIKSQGVETTTHGFRHAMRDRLRAVNAPSPIQDAVGGWGKQTIGDNYGHGHYLETLKGWLDKVVA